MICLVHLALACKRKLAGMNVVATRDEREEQSVLHG